MTPLVGHLTTTPLGRIRPRAPSASPGPAPPATGADGHGGPIAPDLAERVPNRDDPTLVRTLLTVKGAMPAWATRFDDQGFADLRAHLRGQLGAPE